MCLFQLKNILVLCLSVVQQNKSVTRLIILTLLCLCSTSLTVLKFCFSEKAAKICNLLSKPQNHKADSEKIFGLLRKTAFLLSSPDIILHVEKSKQREVFGNLCCLLRFSEFYTHAISQDFNINFITLELKSKEKI